jgi:DNA-3-methyladenine glycosylase I
MTRARPALITTNGVTRCWWAAGDALYTAYHDREWGRPVRRDRRLFEKLALEGFQAGLAWITILRKREQFRLAFHGFDPVTVARFGPRDVARLLNDPGIVRHRGKIEAVIHNAGRVLAIQRELGSFTRYIWRFAPAPDRCRAPTRRAAVPAHTAAARALAADLRRRGFRFVGPTTVYAFMQAMGLLNDHIVGCAFRRPGRRA